MSFFRPLLALAALGPLAGCSSVENLMPHSDPDTLLVNRGANPALTAKLPTDPAEKPKVMPVASQDINCPIIDIPDGSAYVRVGGADNASVRYQFTITDTARQCDPSGTGDVLIKIGIAGQVVIGPAGSAGTYSVPLRVTVTDDRTKKPVFSQTYKVEATTDGVQAGAFRIVTDPIAAPMPTLQLDSVYSISVGFEGGGGGGGAPKQHRHKKSG